MEGHMPGDPGLQVRGQAWGFRNRVEAEAISPDSSPEQSYYDLMIHDTLAAWEAEHEITGTAYQGNAMWNWGHKFGNADAANGCWLWCYSPVAGVNLGAPTAIHFWAPESTGLNGYPEKSSFAGASTSPWMVQYLIYALGRAKDLGYPSQALLAWIAPWIIDEVTDPGYNPYLVASYRQPTVQANGQYFTTWAAVKAAMCTSTADGCSTNASAQTAQTFDQPVNPYGLCAFNANGDGACSAPYEAGMAIAQVADQPNGSTAWNWIYSTAMNNSALNSNPKWAIIPRSVNTTVSGNPTNPTNPTSPASSCDLNSDGVVNNTDVQIAIGQALGTSACTTADLLQNGQCSVVDVQRVINASMGGACVTGGH
jgi:hypothetical protein